jgi:hypothetical protein
VGIELLYPRELREVIADLRAKGDLNERALKQLNKGIYFAAGMSCIWIVTFFYYMSLWSALYFSIAVTCLLVFDYYRQGDDYFYPYINGLRGKAVVKSVRAGIPIFLNNRLICKDLPTAERVEIAQLGDAFFGEYGIPRKGDVLFYFQDSERRHKAMPDIQAIKEKFCLSKSAVKEQMI